MGIINSIMGALNKRKKTQLPCVTKLNVLTS